VATPQSKARARRTAGAVAQHLSEDIRRLREDSGLTRAALAAEAGLDRTFLGRVEDGVARPSLETYARIAGALGADLSARLYPNTGPIVRDRHQARILEALLAIAHPRWRGFTEVAVRRPARGWIDLVLHDLEARMLVAVEIQSTLPRVEQLVRWSAEKASSLPSWIGFGQLGEVIGTSQLLVVRSTRATRDIGRQFARQLQIAYPAHPQDALEALTGDRDWPGPALVWAGLDERRVRFLPNRLREVAAGHGTIRPT